MDLIETEKPHAPCRSCFAGPHHDPVFPRIEVLWGRLALSDINLQIEKGEFVLLMGASGAGKATPLKLLFGSERPMKARCLCRTRNVGSAESVRSSFLATHAGICVPGLSLAAEKDVLRQRRHAIDGTGCVAPEYTKKVLETLKAVGVEHRKESRPAMLSAGGNSSVSVLRALW